MKTTISTLITAVALWLGQSEPQPTLAPPTPGLTIPVTVTDVIDGDTVTVALTIETRVRLLDCWSPESRTTDLEEKQRGLAAKEYLRSLVAGKDCRLHVPPSDNGRFDGLMTLSRIKGSLWLDGENISERMVAAGHATRTKEVSE